MGLMRTFLAKITLVKVFGSQLIKTPLLGNLFQDDLDRFAKKTGELVQSFCKIVVLSNFTISIITTLLD